jgi:hypothetical protein
MDAAAAETADMGVIYDKTKAAEAEGGLPDIADHEPEVGTPLLDHENGRISLKLYIVI